jgi:hypothetical protein
MSGTGSSYAYIDFGREKQRLVTSYGAGPWFDEIAPSSFRYLAIRGDTAYLARIAEKWHVVRFSARDDRPRISLPYDEIPSDRFTAYTDRANILLYAVREGARWRVISDSQWTEEQQVFDGVGTVQFAPGTQDRLFTAKKDSCWGIYRNYRKLTWHPYETIGPLVLSQDNKRILFAARIQGKMTPMLLGPLIRNKDDTETVLRGPTGQQIFVYAHTPEMLERFSRWESSGQVFEQPLSRQFDEVGKPVISPDGQRWLFPVREQRRWRVLDGGTLGGRFAEVRDLAVSPDGTRAAYCARDGQQWYVVENGVVSPPLTAVHSLMYTPDNRLVYAARTLGKWYVFIDGRKDEVALPWTGFDEIGRIVAHADGRVAYRAFTYDDTISVLVLNGTAEWYQHIFDDGMRFTDTGELVYWALDYAPLGSWSHDKPITTRTDERLIHLFFVRDRSFRGDSQ